MEAAGSAQGPESEQALLACFVSRKDDDILAWNAEVQCSRDSRRGHMQIRRLGAAAEIGEGFGEGCAIGPGRQAADRDS